MKSATQNHRKGPLDFATLNYNSNYFASNDDDLQLSIKSKLETKFKFELGGLLVYDSKAKIIADNEEILDISLNSEDKSNQDILKRDIKKSAHSGN